MKRSWLARHPIGFMALYTIFYLSVFHHLEANVPLRSILVHCRLDDLIPFCKYAVIPYFAWFLWIPFTLFYLLWKAPREDFWRLCLIFEAPRRRWMRPAAAVLCVSIVCSTVLLKQHSCIDVALGALLALALDSAFTALERSQLPQVWRA